MVVVREAARRDLDPNVWFHDMEYIAEEKIGHETVTYVSNIYKYYVAYRLIQESLEDRAKVKKPGKGKAVMVVQRRVRHQAAIEWRVQLP